MSKTQPHVPDMLPVLSRGKHRSPRKGACFMELASYLAGERWSDHPACTHSWLAAVARLVNDHTSDEGRPLLAELIPSVIGLTGDELHIDALITLRWDPKRPYRARFRGPVVLLGLRQDEVTTSADFDWKLLHRPLRRAGTRRSRAPQDDRVWQTTPPRPTDAIDRANWQSIVAAGAPRWLGKGWGMKVAERAVLPVRWAV
jgi:hypothetical protein